MPSWNRYQEQLLKKWAQMSKTYSVMHSLCAQYYANWHKRLGIPVVIIGGITASSIFSSNKNNSEVWTYINGGLALCVAGLSGISSFLGTSEKTNKHQTASYKYSKISMDIDTMLSFARNDRSQSPQEFIQEKKACMLEIRENVPEVLPWVMNNYLQKFDKTLTNTKTKIKKNNANSEVKLKSLYIDDNSTAQSQTESETEPSRSYSDADADNIYENMNDYKDKSTATILSASKKMKVTSESDSDSDEDTNPNIIHC